MGADASAYLFLGVDFDDVYEKKMDVTEYDIHDTKTGQKTGQKGKDTKAYWLNKHTGEKFYDTDRYELPTEKWTNNLEQESTEYVIGIKVERISEQNGGYKWFDQSNIDKARAEFEQHVRPFVGNLDPKLCLNLYWSY